LGVSATGTAPFNYQWSTNSALAGGNTASPTFTPTAEGNYTFNVTVTDAWGSSTTCTVNVCVLDIHVPGTGTCPTGCGGQVYVCHYCACTNPQQTIAINASDVEAYLAAHPNDRLGRCDQSCGSLKDGDGSTAQLIQDESKPGFELLLFPNPFKNQFHLVVESSDVDQLVNIRMFDAIGQLVVEKSEMAPNQDVVLGDNLLKGMYFAEITQGSVKKTIRIVKAD
jgi:PKD repeat protein